MEDYTMQPPVTFDDENVMWGAENCNAYPEEDVMRPLDEMDWIPPVMRTICSHMDGCNSYNAASRSVSPVGWTAGVIVALSAWTAARA